jgi:hypothetical protein
LCLTAWLLVGLLTAGPAGSASAQDQVGLVLSGLQTEAFPAVQFNLEAYDAQGNFIADLRPEELQLSEDGQPLSGQTLELVEPGLQFILALNPGAQLSTRIGDQTQLDLLRNVLIDWTRKQGGSGGSDFSLSTNTGLQLIHSREPQEWAGALTNFQPNLENNELNLFSLSTAIDLAADQPVADPRMKRAILFVTPPVAVSLGSGLQDLATRAQQSGVRVFIWAVVPDIATAKDDTSALQSLAATTGGRFTLVAGPETYPDLESWLAPLRKIYQVKFVSSAHQSGAHTLSVRVERTGSGVLEQSLSYSLELAPPNPIFLSPPARLERVWEKSDTDGKLSLLPEQLALQIVIEFPDGYTRPLQAVRLYLDGALVGENTVAPFDRFSWDLSGLTESGMHSLRVEAVDTLGMSGSSIESPVELVVAPRPAANLLERISRSGLIAVAAVVLAGAVLALVLIGENRLRGRRKRGDKRRREDPVTQPVPIPQDAVTRGKRAATDTASWPRGPAIPAVEARLIRVTEDEQPVPGSLIPLNRSEITFGSDPRQAIVLVEDASVGKLHARLLHSEDGGFILMDEGSAAGTWVNYTQISTGVRLKHEDLIHLGRVMFRFELTNPPIVRQPSVQAMGEGE